MILGTFLITAGIFEAVLMGGGPFRIASLTLK